jgi:hypothetical protein
MVAFTYNLNDVYPEALLGWCMVDFTVLAVVSAVLDTIDMLSSSMLGSSSASEVSQGTEIT